MGTQSQNKPLRVAIMGYGVIGKRVADAVLLQDDMQLAGIADVAADWRLHVAASLDIPMFAAGDDAAAAMKAAGLPVRGTLDNLLQ